MKMLLTGNEAIARGAYEAGVKFASAYPGTPSSEILENISLYKGDILAEWATNEKVALEAVVGASLGGVRAIASMKQVGLNVAADPLFTGSYIGVNGGLVIITADEPGMHSSQNEQDNRNYAKAAKIPMFEPSDSQEAKDMVKMAFDMSEKFNTPILIRVTTRICHSKSIVECQERMERKTPQYVKKHDIVPIPINSRRMRVEVEDRTNELIKFAETTELNKMEINKTEVGIVASGVCANYAKEVFGDTVSYLKLGFTYPLPIEIIKEFASKVERIYVIEENDKYLEDYIKALGIKCHGKDVLPYTGEMLPNVIRKCILDKENEYVSPTEGLVIPRPGTLCAGCPHRGFYYELARTKDIIVSGDIGCYGGPGYAKPFSTVDFLLCMGASISMAHGCQKAQNTVEEGGKRVFSVIGDSTFFHTGINSLINVVYNKGNTITCILDNRITAMTGHQENPGSGFTCQGDETVAIDIETVVRAIGIKNITTVNPNNLSEVRSAIDKALATNEASVIITRWPCALKKFTQEEIKEFNNPFKTKSKIIEDKCIGCKKCSKVGCPALYFNKKTKKAEIDEVQCLGCGVCEQVCKKGAIVKGDK